MHRLRRLKRTDLSMCARLYVSTFNSRPWNDHWTVPAARKRLQDILDAPRFYGLIIENGPELAGAVFGNIERWYDRNHYNLKEMFVRPNLQGMGLGSIMMTRACTDLKKRNVIGVYLFTSTTGGVSRFYLNNHFAKVKGMQMMNLSLKSKGSQTTR